MNSEVTPKKNERVHLKFHLGSSFWWWNIWGIHHENAI
jgi:hypothetical protein